MKLLCASAFAVFTALLATASVGCGGDEIQYQPKPAYSGKKATLPAVPTLPAKKKKDGDAFTIWGVTHELRSRVHHDDVSNKKLSLVGYIVKTNYSEKCADKNNTAQKDDCTPECAIHKTGKQDVAECKSPIPTFWIADTKDEKKDMIAVMGWSSNFAQMFTLIDALSRAPKGKEAEVKLADEFWGGDLPNPLPAIGMKVKITGQYAETFTKATGGAASNPKYGIMTYEKMEVLEPAAEAAILPGMKKR